MDLREFASDFQDNVKMAVEMGNSDYDQELAGAILEYLEDNGEVNVPELCVFQKTRTRITAYDYNDEAESLDLFYLIKAETLLGKVNKSKIEQGFNYLMSFYRESMNGTLLKSVSVDNNDEIAEVAKLVQSTKGKINQLRLYVITNGLTDPDVGMAVESDDGEYIIEYNVWDMQRVYQQHNIRTGKEKVEIDFPTEYNTELQCLKMSEENPFVDAYMAIIPGITLAKIYKKYQQVLLEKNVRTFLQFKGKVNKGIRKTLREEPDMFFSYNNGISTTASEIEVKDIDGTLYITRLYDWQIVNGGQTTASISASLNDRDVELGKVFVPMKISVIRDAENSESIIKAISTSANSQTAIKNSDFSANEPYLVDLEKYSRSEWVPNGNAKPVCKWYFERTRGQYLDQLAQLSGYNEKSFKREYPKNQKITKTDIAKYEASWNIDVKDEILLPDRKLGSGNGTVHVFLGAADAALRTEFANYYTSVEKGEDTSVQAVKVKHVFTKSNVLSMLGYVCQYYKAKGEDYDDVVNSILGQLEVFTTSNELITTESLFKLSTGSNKLRPYFKQFDDKGAFHKVIRQLLLPQSAYKISLYKNSANEYAAFWLIGFSELNDFEADSSKAYLQDAPKGKEETCHLQQIFYGAPGTGKSYTINRDTAGEDVIRTTFHPDTDYSTFVGAYKPTTIEEEVMTVIGTKAVPVENADGSHRKESKIVYEFVQQAFLQAYVAAWKKYAEASGDEPRKQFLVIEEINRGNCAQIFGDLFQLLDRNAQGFSDYPITADADMKRQLKKAFAGLSLADADNINAMYNGRNVSREVLDGDILLLPGNLYIWATMNTSDQSLFPIDSAFKRRWDWTYRPISDAREGWKIKADGNLYDWWVFLQKINDKVGSLTNSEDKKLGYFFCKANGENIISADTFVGKVIFYLWNDVFKDYEFGDTIFDDGKGGKLTFDKFYVAGAAGETKVVEDNIALFLKNLGVEPTASVADADTEEYEGQQESTENPEKDKSDWSATELKRYEFWEAFLTYGQQNEEFSKYFGGVKKASKDHWKNFFISGVDFYFVALQQRKKNAADVQVYFDETNDTFHRLYAHKTEIEQEMGVVYNWKELPEKKSSYISERMSGVDFEDKESWTSVFDFFIDRFIRMRTVFLKYAKE